MAYYGFGAQHFEIHIDIQYYILKRNMSPFGHISVIGCLSKFIKIDYNVVLGSRQYGAYIEMSLFTSSSQK